MSKKSKLNLNDLKVMSFTTSIVKAGLDTKVEVIDAYTLKKPCDTFGCNVTHPQICTGNLIKVCPVL